MNPKQLDRFKDILLKERRAIIEKAARTLAEDATFDTNELPDEIDQASAEYDHSFLFRIRDREQFYLRKINNTLAKIEKGGFGICEECGEPISLKRLEARPVTSLCIICKEEQEVEERSWSG